MRYRLKIGGLHLRYDSQRKPKFYVPPVDDDTSLDGIGLDKPETPDLELCIVPEIAGNEQQLQLAREIKEALETFRQKDETKEYAEGFLGKFKIFAGDEVPPCPCCGRRR
jgi:hypothetical protein